MMLFVRRAMHTIPLLEISIRKKTLGDWLLPQRENNLQTTAIPSRSINARVCSTFARGNKNDRISARAAKGEREKEQLLQHANYSRTSASLSRVGSWNQLELAFDFRSAPTSTCQTIRETSCSLRAARLF
jgi:hypothetical protein